MAAILLQIAMSTSHTNILGLVSQAAFRHDYSCPCSVLLITVRELQLEPMQSLAP